MLRMNCRAMTCAGSSTLDMQGIHWIRRPHVNAGLCYRGEQLRLLCRRTAALTDQLAAATSPAVAALSPTGSPVRAADSTVGGYAVAQQAHSSLPAQPHTPRGAALGGSRAPFSGSIDVCGMHTLHAAAEPDDAAHVPDRAAAVLHGEASSPCEGISSMRSSGTATEPDSEQLCAHASLAEVPAQEPPCAAAAERAQCASMPGPLGLAAASAADKPHAGSGSPSVVAPCATRCTAVPPAKGHAKPVLAPAAVQGRWRARGAAGCAANAGTMQPGCQGSTSNHGADQRAGLCSDASAHQQQLEHCAGISSPAEGRRDTRIPSCRSGDPGERRAASSSPTEGPRAARIPSCRSSGHAEDGAAGSSPGADPLRALGRRGGDWRPQSAGAGGPGRVQRAASCWEGRLTANLG